MRQLKIIKQITNRTSQSLDKYLQEIGKVDLITIYPVVVEVNLLLKIMDMEYSDQVQFLLIKFNKRGFSF